MTRDKVYFENRISLLTNRNRENANIVKKLQRQLKRVIKNK